MACMWMPWGPNERLLLAAGNNQVKYHRNTVGVYNLNSGMWTKTQKAFWNSTITIDETISIYDAFDENLIPDTCVAFDSQIDSEQQCKFSVFMLPKVNAINISGEVTFTCCTDSEYVPSLWWYASITKKMKSVGQNFTIYLNVWTEDNISHIFFICGEGNENELAAFRIGKLVLVLQYHMSILLSGRIESGKLSSEVPTTEEICTHPYTITVHANSHGIKNNASSHETVSHTKPLTHSTHDLSLSTSQGQDEIFSDSSSTTTHLQVFSTTNEYNASKHETVSHTKPLTHSTHNLSLSTSQGQDEIFPDSSSTTTHLQVLSTTNDTLSAVSMRLEIWISLIVVFVISLFVNIAVCIETFHKIIARKICPPVDENCRQTNIKSDNVNGEETMEMTTVVSHVPPSGKTGSYNPSHAGVYITSLRQSTPSSRRNKCRSTQSGERQHKCDMPIHAICSEDLTTGCHPNSALGQSELLHEDQLSTASYESLGNDHPPSAIYESIHDEKSEKDHSDIPDSGIQLHSKCEYVNSANFHEYQEYGRDKSSPGIYQALHD